MEEANVPIILRARPVGLCRVSMRPCTIYSTGYICYECYPSVNWLVV